MPTRVIDDPREVVLVAKAIGSKTRWTILQLLHSEALDVSQLAERIGHTEANVSAQLKILEKAGLIECRYRPGSHGVRKICTANIDTLTLHLFSSSKLRET